MKLDAKPARRLPREALPYALPSRRQASEVLPTAPPPRSRALRPLQTPHRLEPQHQFPVKHCASASVSALFTRDLLSHRVRP